MWQKNAFSGRKRHFLKRSFYRKFISDPKYHFSVHQKWIFVVQPKVSIFHRIQPSYGTKSCQKYYHNHNNSHSLSLERKVKVLIQWNTRLSCFYTRRQKIWNSTISATNSANLSVSTSAAVSIFFYARLCKSLGFHLRSHNFRSVLSSIGERRIISGSQLLSKGTSII